MRTDLMPDALWEEAEPLAPPHPPSPKGGRPRVPNRACLAALSYLLREGCTYRGLPCRELGCGSGVTVWRRLQEWNRAGTGPRLHEALLRHLGKAGEIDTSIVVAYSPSRRAVKGGPTPDPTPRTGRSKASSGMYLPTPATCRWSSRPVTRTTSDAWRGCWCGCRSSRPKRAGAGGDGGDGGRGLQGGVGRRDGLPDSAEAAWQRREGPRQRPGQEAIRRREDDGLAGRRQALAGLLRADLGQSQGRHELSACLFCARRLEASRKPPD